MVYSVFGYSHTLTSVGPLGFFGTSGRTAWVEYWRFSSVMVTMMMIDSSRYIVVLVYLFSIVESDLF